eukprot:7578153-Karenia_brevis.AAC.1
MQRDSNTIADRQCQACDPSKLEIQNLSCHVCQARQADLCCCLCIRVVCYDCARPCCYFGDEFDFLRESLHTHTCPERPIGDRTGDSVSMRITSPT